MVKLKLIKFELSGLIVYLLVPSLLDERIRFEALSEIISLAKCYL